VAVGLLDEQGRDLPLQLEGEASAGETTRVLSLTEPKQTFRFTGLPGRPHLSLLRGFSAPVKLHTGYDDAGWRFRLAHDSDDFNRWEAGQELALGTLLRLIGEVQRKSDLQVEPSLLDAFGAVLRNETLDKALVARILTLPSESYIADQMEVVDVEAIHEARQFLRRSLARHLEEIFLKLYEDNVETTPYRFSAEDMARRSLKNMALGYLMALDEPAFQTLCVDQYETRHNMTDQMAALALLADVDIPARQAALDDFYQRWQHDPQVVEKWLALQAGSSLPDTLQRVEALMQHPAFDLHNPNKVRALIGRFCAGNPLRFHAADGAGYRFLADRVLELDPLNPSIAARLVKNLSRWRRYDPARQALMKAQLERIVAQEGLSKDVYEIASRSLEG
jgi:aminopeptidase N